MDSKKIYSREMLRILFYNSILAGIGYLIFQILSVFLLNFKIILSSDYYQFFIFFLFLLFLVLDKKASKRPLSDYGIKKPKLEHLKLAVMFFSLLFITTVPSRLFFPEFDSWYAPLSGLTSLGGLTALLLITPVFTSSEEISQRGLIQSKLSNIFGSRISLLIVGINFAVLHLSWFWMGGGALNTSLIFLTLLPYSFLAALLFEHSKNIFTTLFFHILTISTSAIQTYWHVTNNLNYEYIFWIIWGLSFIFLFSKSIKYLMSTIKRLKGQKITSDLYIPFIILSIFPILVFLILYQF